jgi:hypothetical protein
VNASPDRNANRLILATIALTADWLRLQYLGPSDVDKRPTRIGALQGMPVEILPLADPQPFPNRLRRTR